MDKPKRLFHFCSEQHVRNILQAGISWGRIPVYKENWDGSHAIEFIKGFQWLTDDSDFTRQSWATQHIIEYDRTAFRLTVEIPKKRRKYLIHWKSDNSFSNMAEELNKFEGSDHWWIYAGNIKVKWIKEVNRKPEGSNNV